jgi:UTP--glucose-1-phosphate uridylyltransferase
MSVKPVRKAIFPVAGFGTRFLPATKAVPKELLPVVDRPLIQYAVDEALAAGFDQLIFVTGRSKHAIEDYFDRAFEIESDLHAKQKTEIIELLKPTRLKPGQAAFVRQQEMSGLGHAVWCAKGLIGDEPFAVLLPDELLWNPANPCLKQMRETYDAKGGNVISVVAVPPEHTHRYGVITPGEGEGAVTEIKGMVEKPKQGTAPSNLAVVGRYILQPDVLDILDAGKKGAGGEIQLTDAMAELIGKQPFNAQTFDGVRYDCGEKLGFIQANVALALERDDIGPALREWLKTL